MLWRTCSSIEFAMSDDLPLISDRIAAFCWAIGALGSGPTQRLVVVGAGLSRKGYALDFMPPPPFQLSLRRGWAYSRRRARAILTDASMSISAT